jgi:N-methylhydantoinase A
MAWRIGCDIGGTFADFAALEVETGRLATLKVLTTPAEPGGDVAAGLARLDEIAPAEVAGFVHGTTVGVNTLLQRRGARLALFTTQGFTDMLELARLRMPETYGLYCERAAPLVPRERVFPVAERMDAEGRTVRAPSRASVEAALVRARRAGAEGLVVSFLHAWRNPAHEIAVADMLAELAPDLFVFRGAEVWPAIREYERTTTAVMNAYVHPRVAGYLGRVEGVVAGHGIGAPMLLTTSAGGTMTGASGRRDCVGMLLSGTASGVIGAGVVARAAGEPDVLTLDVGGTSADIALLRGGRPSFGAGQEIGEHPLAIPTVAVNSVGRGGGSLATIDEHGVLQVGPQSAGSDPGPACFGRGGEGFTVTDAALICGVLGHGELGFGAIRLDRAPAERLAAGLAGRLGVGVPELAEGVIAVAVSGMLVEIEKLLARAGAHASELTLMPFGGAGPMLGALLAEAAGIGRVLVPPAPGTLCALGALAADLRRDALETVLLPLDAAAWPRLAARFAAVGREAGEALEAMAGEGAAMLRLGADLRYRGQSHELSLDVPAEAAEAGGPDALAALFHAEHLAQFGHAEAEAPVEVLSVRAQAIRPAPPIPLTPRPERAHEPAPSGRAALALGGGGEAAIHRRADLAPGAGFQGPAIVTQDDSTLLVPAGWRARADGLGNLVLERG